MAHLMERERWAIAALAISGAAFMPHALNRFVFAKLAIAALGVVLAFTVPRRGRLPPSAVALLAAAALAIVVAALLAATPVAQVIGRAPRYEGAVTLTIYLGACIAGARLLGAGRARGATAWFLRVLAVASIAIGVQAMLEVCGVRLLSTDAARPGSLLGQASDLGAWGVLALGPLAAVALHTRDRLLVAGAVAAAAGIVASGSRGALLGALVALLVLALAASERRHRVALVLMTLVLVAAAFALPATRDRLTGSSPFAARTVSGRVLLWHDTVRLLATVPLLGVGPSGYLDAIPRFHTRRYERAVGPVGRPDSPHNWLLQSAAAGGLLLTAVALALAGLTMRRGYRSSRAQRTRAAAAAFEGMLAGLAGYSTALLTHFTSPGTTPLAATLAGALLSAPPSEREGSPRRLLVPRRVATGSAGALAALTIALLIAAALAEIPLRSATRQAVAGQVAEAGKDLRLARSLRAWDPEIAASATHLYATLAAASVPGAALEGRSWSEDELAALPRSVQALEDAATLAAARNDEARAAALVSDALDADPNNPLLHLHSARIAVQRGRRAQAIESLRRARELMPASPAAWRALAAAFRAAGDEREAGPARARAQQLEDPD